MSFFMNNCLKGQVAMITGGATGIGYGISQKLMENGCKIFITSRNIKQLEESSKKLIALTNGECIYTAADVRNKESVERAVDYALSHYGKIDILINCAAGNFMVPLNDLSINGFKTVWEIDTLGTFICSKVVFEKCFKDNAKTIEKTQSSQGSNIWGKTIINISMTLHYNGTLFQTHAGAAKAGIDAMTKHMAVEWGPYNIRVNAIAPGSIVNTKGLEKLSIKSASTGKQTNIDILKEWTPLQRLGTPNDIGELVVFLSLPVSSWITGSIIVIDGGQSLTIPNFPLLDPTIKETWLNRAKL